MKTTKEEGLDTPGPTPAGFPRDLLEQPTAARLRYFETKMVAHQRLKDVHAALLHAIRHPAGASLILVFGPTGVGKTTLSQRIVRQLIEDAAADPTTTPGHIPVVSMVAAASDASSFSWKDYYTRALLAMDEPLVADKVTYETRGIHRDEQGRLLIERNLTVPDLRRVLEKCLFHRRPRAFLVDEAQHFKKLASGRRRLDQMDALKSLAGMTQTVHVLLGTYELLGLLHLSAQLSRRSSEIHFPRYRADRPEDLKEFKKLLRTLQRHLPLPEEPDLEGHADYFYERSLGCTGILKDWLSQTLAAVLEQGERTLTPKRWEQQAGAPGKLLSMLREIREGEQALEEDAQARQQLRTLLSLEGRRPPTLEATGTEDLAAPPPLHESERPKRRPRRVGQRNPARDPVGREAPHAG